MSSDELANFASVITVLAALGGVVIAGLGLRTWKSQGIWHADNDLARRLLIGI